MCLPGCYCNNPKVFLLGSRCYGCLQSREGLLLLDVGGALIDGAADNLGKDFPPPLLLDLGRTPIDGAVANPWRDPSNGFFNGAPLGTLARHFI